MTQSLTIRSYTKDDEDDLIALIRELQEYELAIEPRMKPASAIGPWYIENFQNDVKKHGGDILLAEIDGNVCGYAALLLTIDNGDPYEVDYTYAEVSELAVTATSRGTGVGKALLDECEKRARAHGAKYFRIAALSKNERALAVYRRAGFTDRMTKLEKTLN